ncbi:ATP-binding protein [Streptomyces sp. NPDC089915]|uniref:ATP-binding protein n=1 Tax=Streptomyces sp. NPDC089915 TaxID=3155186 RepID=UPI00342A8C74
MTESGKSSQPAQVNEYTASDIRVLDAREAIRKRPGMYIGSSGERGLHQMVYEVVAYAVDEHLAGHGGAIDVTITADGGVRVADHGRGMPVEGIERELTELSFGSKPRTGYGTSGGLGGVGLCVVGALSSRLTVEVRRDGRRWTQAYEKGVPVTALTRHEETGGHGTAIAFLPDAGIFEPSRFSFATLSERLRELACLNEGLAVSLTDERPERPVRHHHSGGLPAYLAHLSPHPSGRVHSAALAFASQNADRTLLAEVAMEWNTGSPGGLHSFANSTRTVEGGAHEHGFRTALTDLLNDYARRHGLLPPDGGDLSAEAVDEGLTAVLSVKLTHPVFEGCTKTRLGNPEAMDYVREVVRAHLTEWLERNPGDAAAVVRHVLGRAATGNERGVGNPG